MPETWPGTLPPPLYDGYGETAPSTLIRTTMDAGPAKVRRRFTAGVRKFSLSLQLTLAQVAVLDQFYVDILNGGQDQFWWNHPRTGEAKLFRFAGEPPSYQPWSDNVWLTTLALEILP